MSIESLTVAEQLDDDDVVIGRRVHDLMWVRRMTGVKLAKSIGINQSALSKKLRGERGWTPANLRLTASALETTIAYLVGEVGDPDWCTPRDLNPEPTVIGLRAALQRGRRALEVVSIDEAFQIRQRRARVLHSTIGLVPA